MVVFRFDEKIIMEFFDNFVDSLFYECGVMCIDRVLKFVWFIFDFDSVVVWWGVFKVLILFIDSK